MSITLNTNEPAIVRGIKTVGIGKKGSKPLPSELIHEILIDLKAGKVSNITKGAFIGALLMKGPTDEEKKLEEAFEPKIFSHPEKLIEYLSPRLPDLIKNFCIRLMQQQTLSTEESQILGDFLFSDTKGDGARGLIASILRVRYETDEEYEGLLRSIEKTFEPAFKQAVPKGNPIIQIADPFDGVDQTNIITPLIADYLQNLDYRVVNVVGRSSGPKLIYNLYDIAKNLQTKFIKSSLELVHSPKTTVHRGPLTEDCRQAFGYYLAQKDLSKPMDRWVNLRREIIKRPFLATLERFVNPFKAEILIASAFHAPYGEKMMTVACAAGFPKIIIIRNGIEGSTAFALKRPVKILVAAKEADGKYLKSELEFDPEQYLNKIIPTEEKLGIPDLTTNIELIRTYKEKGKTSNELFNDRVAVTCAGIQRALEWINK